MVVESERDLGRLVSNGIRGVDDIFARVSHDVVVIVRATAPPGATLTEPFRRAAMQEIDQVFDRAFGSTQRSAMTSELFDEIVAKSTDAANTPILRAAEDVQAVLRSDPVRGSIVRQRMIQGGGQSPDPLIRAYSSLFGPEVEGQRILRSRALDPQRRWVDPDGYRLSDRVWRQGKEVRSAVDNTLREGIRRGTSAADLAGQLEQYLDPSQAPTRYTKNGKIVRRNMTKKGGGGYGSSRARALARTEISRVHNQAVSESAKVTPGVIGERYVLSGSHPGQDKCNPLAEQDMFGLGVGVYPVGQCPLPPVHTNCLCHVRREMMGRDAFLDSLVAKYGGGGAVKTMILLWRYVRTGVRYGWLRLTAKDEKRRRWER